MDMRVHSRRVKWIMSSMFIKLIVSICELSLASHRAPFLHLAIQAMNDN
jgi:hypothetical protein